MGDQIMKEGGGCGSGGCGGRSCGKRCGCMHHTMPVVFVLLLGVLFLLKPLAVVSDAVVSMVWPILVIAGALTKLTGGTCKCC